MNNNINNDQVMTTDETTENVVPVGPDIFDSRDLAFMSLRHLVKVYPNGEKAVFDFDMDIQKNEFIVIVGPSGCGKSTTLRMIAGLEDISSGELYMGNELINYKACNNRKMAIVFQNYALYPQFSVYDNIAFPLNINKYTFPVVNEILRADAQIRKILQVVPVEKFIGVLFNSYKKASAGDSAEESAATILNISLKAACILCGAFKPYKNDDLETVVSQKAEELIASIESSLNVLVEKEKTRVDSLGIVYDESFCELDGEGKVKTEERKMTAFEVKREVYAAAELLDLVPYLDKRPRELSGGQMQRVALGRAIVKKVPVFLMDEPLSNLDAKLRVTMRSEIVKLHNSINATTIYVTHDQTEAMTMATRIVVMSKGFVQQIGTPKEIYDNPNNVFVAKFIGTPPMNILNFSFDRSSNTLQCGELKIKAGKKFGVAHDEFYARKITDFENMLSNFDEKASDEVLRILSATGENFAVKQEKKHKLLSIANIKKLIKKLIKKFKKPDPNLPPPVDPRKPIAESKLAELKNTDGEHILSVGIRSERIKAEKYDPKIHDNKENVVVLNPTVCELLGSTYIIHFVLNGMPFVAQLDAQDIITVNDRIAVSIDFADVYVFDPITGDTIKTKERIL